jgi:CP2 transcription factor.
MPDTAEMSFCIVKLFRDHGAERKMFNDVSQLKRAIEKRKQDFVKVQGGSDSLGKRKRGKYPACASDQVDNQLQALTSK